ncbi:MAG TPA: hypothetical protein PKM73_19330 [Verrucomicrobiota bacterium]|nr:hypothetical protein [Verrucomicrobiota bacterium]HNU51183.1 hypothetical protein [Verrucomicrobiota bacterium]
MNSRRLLLCSGAILILGAMAPSLRAQSAAPSWSKLGLHVRVRLTDGTRQVLGAHPRILKIVGTTPAMLETLRTYKAGTPGGLAVLRVPDARTYLVSEDPAASARDFWNRALAPALGALSATDRALIDFVEGPNACDQTPCWGTVDNARWLGDFWSTLAPLIRHNGFRPCAFSIPAGAPGGTAAEVEAQLDAIIPALRTCQANDGAWSYHASTASYTQNVAQELATSLRYRQFYDFFRVHAPDLVSLPLLLTEAGIDNGKGWNDPANGDAAKYQSWLQWWDLEIRKDPAVLGAALFEIGEPETWASWDLEPMAPWIASHLESLRPTTPILRVVPDEIRVETQVGRKSTETILQVRNDGAGTLTFNTATDAAWLSARFTANTSTGEVQAVTVRCSTTGMPSGSFYGTVTVTAPGASNSPVVVPVLFRVYSSDPVPELFEDFQYPPNWTSAFDAGWGDPAVWLLTEAGFPGRGLQIARPAAGSSVRVLTFPVVPYKAYTASICVRCPSSTALYTAECAYRLGDHDAADLEQHSGSWTRLKKFSNPGGNGNNNTWTTYGSHFKTGPENRLTVAWRSASTDGAGPTVLWDTLRLTPDPLLTLTFYAEGGAQYLYWEDAFAVLQSSHSLFGPWQSLPQAGAPYAVPAAGAPWFFRLTR